MAEERDGTVGTLSTILFAAFIAFKVVGGHYVSTWSWWWLLMPAVPFIGAAIHGSW